MSMILGQNVGEIAFKSGSILLKAISLDKMLMNNIVDKFTFHIFTERY